MPLIKFFAVSCTFLFFLSCGGEKRPEDLFSITLSKENVQTGDTLQLDLQSKAAAEASDISFFLDGAPLRASGNGYPISPEKLGVKKLSARFQYEGETVEVSRDLTVLARNAPEIYTYEIVNIFPHDRNAFTQGLEFYQGTLYESTGRHGESTLRKVDFNTGEVLEQVALDRSYFGEGITIMNDKIYQLTWQSKVGFIYDLQTMEREGRFNYGRSKEGWGLCNDGSRLYKSDGTDKIWLLDPESLTEQGYLQTVSNKSVFNKANELEYINGKIYANVWQKESMMIIDAKSGAIEGVVNFGGLKEQVTKHPKLDVLNGVAWHPERETLFVTGKYWDKLFEVRIKPRS